MRTATLSLAYALFLTGCFTPQRLVDSPNLTLSAALKDVGRGFASLEEELGERTLGLFPCSLTVSLNVRASANEQGQLVVDSQAGTRFEGGRESEASRENEVQIGLYNPACVPSDTVGYENPTSVGALKSGMIITQQDLNGAENPPAQ